MGQIVSAAAKPKRCNLQSLSSFGTPAAGEYILVSSDNSMNAAGQGNFDCYIEGNGTDAATALEVKPLDGGVANSLNQLNVEIHGKDAVNISGVVPMVYNQVNQRVNGAKCVISIPKGTYLFNIDTSYIGASAYVYVRINGTDVSLGLVSKTNGKSVTLDGDATEFSVFANAANSPATGDCVFSFSQDGVSGLEDDIESLQESEKKITGTSNSVDCSFTLTTAVQSASDTKKDIVIKAGKYWVDVPTMSVLKETDVNVYAYYKSAPTTSVLIGYLSAWKENYWRINSHVQLQEIEFAEDVVAISIYHANNAVNAGTLTISFVDENTLPSMDERFAQLASQSSPEFTAFRASATLAQDDTISLDEVLVIKNTSLTAEIEGTIESVAIGLGWDESKATNHGYNSCWIVLKPSTFEVWWNDNEDHLLNTYTHGLTLDDHTKVSIIKKVGKENLTYLRIVTKLGDLYENTSIQWQGIGAPFIENQNTSNSIGAKISFMPEDITKKIWIFGDSYCGLFNNARWPTQIRSWGIENFLLDARGGEAMKGAYGNLVNLLKTGCIPTYIVWAMGMNGTGDAAGQTDASYVADYQKLWLMRFLRVCKQNGITPILCTIPSVPSLNHEALSAYVKTLGYRYIDFADAVGSQLGGTWYSGLLSSDNAHPTVQGAIVLAMRVLRDFPEITTE